jgi:hypothetical protein
VVRQQLSSRSEEEEDREVRWVEWRRVERYPYDFNYFHDRRGKNYFTNFTFTRPTT